MALTGDKIKRYLPITCNRCHESYRVNWKDVLDNVDQNSNIINFMCPYCENEVSADVYSLENLTSLESVLDN